MKIRNMLSGLFALLGVGAAAAGIYLSLHNMNAAPRLLVQPEEAKAQVVSVMDAICEGDYALASLGMQGTPNLGMDRNAQGEVGDLIWNTFLDSISYELDGACYATDSGIAQNVVIRTLELNSVTENLRDRSQTLLAQRVEQAEDTSELYDENNEYREDLVMEVLLEATRQALEEDARYVTWNVRLNLVYENGQWWVLPEQELLRAISGGLVK